MPPWYVRAHSRVLVATTYDVEQDYFLGDLRVVRDPAACYKNESVEINSGTGKKLVSKLKKLITKEAYKLIRKAAANGDLKQD